MREFDYCWGWESLGEASHLIVYRLREVKAWPSVTQLGQAEPGQELNAPHPSSQCPSSC